MGFIKFFKPLMLLIALGIIGALIALVFLSFGRTLVVPREGFWYDLPPWIWAVIPLAILLVFLWKKGGFKRKSATTTSKKEAKTSWITWGNTIAIILIIFVLFPLLPQEHQDKMYETIDTAHQEWTELWQRIRGRHSAMTVSCELPHTEWTAIQVESSDPVFLWHDVEGIHAVHLDPDESEWVTLVPGDEVEHGIIRFCHTFNVANPYAPAAVPFKWRPS